MTNGVLVALALSVAAAGVSAQQAMHLKGSNYACSESSKMDLWDRSSELVRHQMLLDDHCWKTTEGLPVDVIRDLGRFAYVDKDRYRFYVYRSDLRAPGIGKPAPEKVIEHRGVRFVKVDNTSMGTGLLIGDMPAVSVLVNAGPGLWLMFHIRKDKLISGFEATIRDQRDDAVQIYGDCRGFSVSLEDEGEEFTVRVLALDRVRKVAEFQIAGLWKHCSVKQPTTHRLVASQFKVEGKQFDELMRKHTAREMTKAR